MPVSPLTVSFAEHEKFRRNSQCHFDWIALGPTLNSARVESVQLHPDRPGTIFVAFGSGNLWKSANHGLSWKPIFEHQAALGIGDIALAPSNPEIIYVGTGESLKKARNFTMPGTGIYRSNDGGDSWCHIGLEDSWHVGEIVVHPENPDIVYVAVLGHFWSTNPNRGVFRTLDGGQSWEHVLYIDEKTGANDIVLASSNPQVLYASMWENYPGISGENSSVYQSTDAGATWHRIMNGLPQSGETGRIGLAVSYTDADKVYALVDNLGRESNSAAEVYRTLDGGRKWRRTHSDELRIFPGIGWYFADIYVNPTDDEEIFALGVRIGRSTNGGKEFSLLGGEVHHFSPSVAQTLHLDHCEMWINPRNPNHLALGNDGGLYISYDRGDTWMHYNNIPVGEFYDVTTDRQNPYYIYGGVQDDATVYGPAREWHPAFNDHWNYLWIDAWSGGDGCITQVDPTDPNTVYFSMQNGAVRRRDMQMDTSVSIRPHITGDTTTSLDFNFIAPYFLSPHDPATIYHAGNYVFRSGNRGEDWSVISSDLTHSGIPEKRSVAAGALAESPLIPGRLYVGMDHGAFWTTGDYGSTWVEYSNAIADNYIRSICPSRFIASRVYMTMTGINYDDFGNYVYASEDFGEHWVLINKGLPNEMANVILEDHLYGDILYLGMYRGVYVSFDQGKSWDLLSTGMPSVSIADLEIQEEANDLIVGTHGRGIYLLNLDPVHEAYRLGIPMSANHLFKVPVAIQPRLRDTHKDVELESVRKVPVTFWLTKDGECTIRVKKADREILWERSWEGKKGFNQFRWDLCYREVDSNRPYFIHYRRYLSKGTYELSVEQEGNTVSGSLRVE